MLELYVSHWTWQFVELCVCGPPSLNPAAGWCALDGIISSMAHTANRGLRESLRARLSATTT